MTRSPYTGAALGALTILCWSSYNVAAKHGIDSGLSPEALTLLRFAVPGVIALPLAALWLVRGKLAPIPLCRLAVLVMVGGPLFGLLAVSGYAYAPLSHGLLFAPVAVFVSGSILGAVLLKERITPTRIIGAMIMFAGLAVLVGFQTSGMHPDWWRGAIYFVAAGAMWGAYTLLLKVWNIAPVTGTLCVAAGAALIALPLLGPAALQSLAATDPGEVVLQTVMQGGVGGILSVAALIGAVRHLPAQVASLLPTFTPAVALGIAFLAYGQSPSVSELVGMVIIAAGFVLSTQSAIMPTLRRNPMTVSYDKGL